MQFNSLEYVIFLPVVFLLYWFVFKRHKWQNVFLLAASYLFYGWWDWRFLLLIAFTSVFSFACGILIENYKGNRKRQKAVNALNIVVNLAILGVFKYFNFFVGNLVELLARFGISLDAPTVKIILPVGISFYTFQALSYTIDIYKEKISASRNIITYATYIAFFPQLVAGPIERAGNLLPQFGNKRVFNYEQAVDGCRQLLWGFFKKIVIADNCAVAVDMVWNGYTTYSGINLVVEGLFLYSIQIYCDFSGYSDIAIGTAKLFGINLMRNFNNPYFARSIPEFWRRWHISLTTWLRDYIYFPLGGSRCPKPRIVLNTIVVFLVNGLWHGADWTFLAFGLYHGLIITVFIIFGIKSKYPTDVAQGRLLPSLRELGMMLLTFALVCIGRIPFRAPSLAEAASFTSQLFTAPFFQFQHPRNAIAIVFAVILLAIEWVQRDKQHALQFAGRGVVARSVVARYAIYAALFLCIVWYSSSVQTFIYFQF